MFGVPIRELLAFPYQRLTLESSLPVANVLKRMEEAVEPRRRWRFSRSHRDFEGVISRTGFKITRIIHYRNSFLPVVEGAIVPVQGGSRIEITMRMHWLVAAFMVAWAGVPMAILGVALLHLHYGPGIHTTSRQTGQGLFAFAALMLCFGYALCSVCFNVEARRAKELLLRIVRGSNV